MKENIWVGSSETIRDESYLRLRDSPNLLEIIKKKELFSTINDRSKWYVICKIK